jgi:hypothetical protein
MNLQNEDKKPETTSTLQFTKEDVKLALIAFAEARGQHFDVSAGALRLYFAPSHPYPRDNIRATLCITRPGTKPAIW